MIRIELSDDHLARTRLALSPLWDVLGSLYVLHSATPLPEHVEWQRRTRRALRGVDLGPFDPGAITRSRYVPDFIAPIPTHPLPALADELELVRATDATTVREHVAEGWPADPPPPWDAFVARPAEMLDRLTDALHRYWDVALAEDWPRMRAVLEGELLARARGLALFGAGCVIDEISPRIRWRRPVVELVKHLDHDMHVAGRPLVLMPMVFAGCMFTATPPEAEALGIGYQARGIAQLWAPEEPGLDGRLEVLLGHGRAAVLRALERPATTTELAGRLGYAPSTVSAHLDVLVRAGVLERHRLRRSVYYRLNDAGRTLLALAVDAPAALSA